NQFPDASLTCQLRRLTRRAVPPAVGFFFHRRFQRRLMHHHIYTSGKPERRRAGGGIPKNSQFFARLRWGKVILTVDDAPVFQRDGLAVLQTLEQRAWFHPISLQRGGVQRPGLVMLLNAI